MALHCDSIHISFNKGAFWLLQSGEVLFNKVWNPELRAFNTEVSKWRLRDKSCIASWVVEEPDSVIPLQFCGEEGQDLGTLHKVSSPYIFSPIGLSYLQNAESFEGTRPMDPWLCGSRHSPLWHKSASATGSTEALRLQQQLQRSQHMVTHSDCALGMRRHVCSTIMSITVALRDAHQNQAPPYKEWEGKQRYGEVKWLARSQRRAKHKDEMQLIVCSLVPHFDSVQHFILRSVSPPLLFFKGILFICKALCACSNKVDSTI